MVLYAAAIGIVTATAAELTARVQDWIRDATPLTSTPNWDQALFVDAATGRRGRPNGHYKKWVMNEFGFRSRPMTVEPQKGTQRIIVLGASETFGLYESPAHEFPAQLDIMLRSQGPDEVVNAALTGLTLGSTVPYWNSWVRRFRPAVVIIYPSPFFYLNDSVAPRPATVAMATAFQPPRPARASVDVARIGDLAASLLLSSRLIDRARDLLDVPDSIQRLRDARTIENATRDKPADWFFQTPPRDRVQLLVEDLEMLVRAIVRDGARPIVLTHASRVADPPRRQDADWLWRARVHTPRALPLVIDQFQTVTNQAIRDWCARSGVAVVDVAADLNGHEDLFGDLIHFNDAGAALVARAVADAIHPLDVAPESSREGKATSRR